MDESQKNTPRIFEYDTNEVRTIPETETTWFVAKDVCNILGISNARQAVSKLDDDEKLTYKLYTSGQQRDTWCINEFGLYQLILTSNKPEAKKFKRWITHEILPTIRKAGVFTSEQAQQLQAENQAIVKRRSEILKRINALISERKDLKTELSEIEHKLRENITNPQQALIPFVENTTK